MWINCLAIQDLTTKEIQNIKKVLAKWSAVEDGNQTFGHGLLEAVVILSSTWQQKEMQLHSLHFCRQDTDLYCSLQPIVYNDPCLTCIFYVHKAAERLVWSLGC